MKRCVFIILVLLSFLLNSFAQDQHGSNQYRARNVHAGNLIRVTFYNHGMLGAIKGDQSLVYAGEWPINSGLVQMGNASSFVGSTIRTFASIDSTGDSLYVDLTPVVFCQGWDPNAFSHDSLGRFLGFEPLPGYYNLTNKEKDPYHAVAMSHQAFTWPAFWPDKLEDPVDAGWRGHWNGYFGKDQKNADEESYYILDDYQFNKKISGLSLPRPIATESLRGGLGLKQFIRGLQWSNPDAQDCIFWIYRIQNIGELKLHQTVFGLNVGASIGARLTANSDYDDDCATFYREIDLTVNYDWDNIGTGGYTPVPWVGFAFLESPGNALDGIDNDGDGLNTPGGGHLITQADFLKFYNVGDPVVLIDYASADYKRTVSTMPAEGVRIQFKGTTYIKKPNAPLQEIPRDGIDDNLNGYIDESDGAVAPDSMTYYLYIRDPKYNNRDYLAKDYLTGEGLANLMIDERRDDGIDNNNDWDANTDDVGLDGKSGTGDAGEGDGQPTAGQGNLPGEPNVDRTDVDESDQIGLTSFIFYEYGAITYSNDAQMWDVSRPGFFDGHLENVDADYIFSCGYFPLLPGLEESFSVAMIYGEDQADILRNKDIVQKIYNSNYNFAVAPEKPRVRAVAGDKKVTLYWDARSESDSYDRYLRVYDFEGYKIYRATDPGFSDAGSISDGYGYPRFVKPLAIYDRVDSVFGFFPKTYGTGVQFNMGSETGLVHTFVDSPLVNGKRYFYAVTAYDKGDVDKNIAPSETNMFVTVDASGEISTGENVVVVVPQAPSLGYQRPEISEQPQLVGSGISSGTIEVKYLQPEVLVDGDRYEVQFLDISMDHRDNDHNGLTDGTDRGELMPTLTTGFVLKNLTRTIPNDTIWFFNYRQELGEWKMVENLYEDNDGDPRTLKATVQGMEFSIYNPPPGLVNLPARSIYGGVQWSKNIDYFESYNIRFEKFNLGGFAPGTEYPRQYQVVFYDQIVKTSDLLRVKLATTNSYIPLPPKDVNYRVFDKLTGEELPFAVVDGTLTPKLVQPGFFSAKDRIILFEKLGNDSTVVTYNILNNSSEDTVFYNRYGRMLGAGDTLNVYPEFPFTGDTRYQFAVRGQKVDRTYAKENLEKIKVVPNPYVVTAAWEPLNPYSSGRGPRSLQFIHLPQKCTIRIFAVDGTLVRTLEHDSPMTDGSHEWDLLTKDNMDLAYGIYIYHIEAPGIGEKTGRILIIK